MASDKLTPRQARFVEEYLIDLNSTQACIRAGYSAKAADVQGPRLLGYARIQAAIQAAKAKRSEETGITAERVLREEEALAFSDIGQILDMTGDRPRLRPANQIPEKARRAIQSVKVKRIVEGEGKDKHVVEVVEFRLWSKDLALGRLRGHVGLPAERIELTGKDGRPLIDTPEQGRDFLLGVLGAFGAAREGAAARSANLHGTNGQSLASSLEPPAGQAD